MFMLLFSFSVLKALRDTFRKSKNESERNPADCFPNCVNRNQVYNDGVTVTEPLPQSSFNQHCGTFFFF